MDVVDMIREFGSLGLLGFVVVWMTRRLNGKLDSLNVHLRENTGAVRRLTSAIERNGK